MIQNGKEKSGWIVRDEDGKLRVWYGKRPPVRERKGMHVHRCGMIGIESEVTSGRWISNGDDDSRQFSWISSFDIPEITFESEPRKTTFHVTFTF